MAAGRRLVHSPSVTVVLSYSAFPRGGERGGGEPERRVGGFGRPLRRKGRWGSMEPNPHVIPNTARSTAARGAACGDQREPASVPDLRHSIKAAKSGSIRAP